MKADHLSNSAAVPDESISLEQWQHLERRLIWVYQGLPNVPNGRSGDEGTLMAWWIQAGGVTFHEPGRSIHFSAGQWVFLPNRVSMRVFEPGAQLLSIKFRLHWLDGRSLITLPAPMAARVSDAASLTAAGKSLLKRADGILGSIRGNSDRYIAERRTSAVLHLALDQTLNSWFAAYVQAAMNLGLTLTPWGAFDDRLARAASLIAQWNWRQGFCIQDLAAQIGLSPSRLSHLFTARMGMSLMRYAAFRRVSQAQHLLEATNRPIKTIAYELGFAQPSHFTSWFTRLAGQSPAAYRHETRMDDEAGAAS